jgi:hypothetical protein
LTHNGIDIDEFILLTIYPTVVIFGIGYLARKINLGESLKYAIQAAASITFSIIYLITIPNGGAQGLALVLMLFALVLFFMARKYKINPDADIGAPTVEPNSNKDEFDPSQEKQGLSGSDKNQADPWR